MLDGLLKKLSIIEKEIAETEDQLANTYMYCFCEMDEIILQDYLEELLDEQEEIEVEIEAWK